MKGQRLGLVGEPERASKPISQSWLWHFIGMILSAVLCKATSWTLVGPFQVRIFYVSILFQDFQEDFGAFQAHQAGSSLQNTPGRGVTPKNPSGKVGHG